MFKRYLKCFIGSLLIIHILNLFSIKGYAMTNNEGAEWAESKVGQSIDYDGVYGAQCVDLVVKFAVENFGWNPIGNAIDLSTQSIPAGWIRIQDSLSFIPERGDIAIWDMEPYGHTAIILSADKNEFVSVDQNWYNSSDNGSPAAIVKHNYANFWGVLRPPYEGVQTLPNPSEVSNSDIGNLIPEDGTFYPNQTINIRDAPNRNANIIGTYTQGEYVKYDNKIISDGHVWISYISSNGERRYMAVRTYDNGVRGELWGEIK